MARFLLIRWAKCVPHLQKLPWCQSLMGIIIRYLAVHRVPHSDSSNRFRTSVPVGAGSFEVCPRCTVWAGNSISHFYLEHIPKAWEWPAKFQTKLNFLWAFNIRLKTSSYAVLNSPVVGFESLSSLTNTRSGFTFSTYLSVASRC